MPQNDKDKANFAKLIEAIEGSKKGKSIGEFSKDQFPGDFVSDWKAALNKSGFEKVRFPRKFAEN